MGRKNIKGEERLSKAKFFSSWLENKLEWIRQNMVVSAIVGSIIFVLVVHFLFKIPAPHEWFVPQWEAGDVLTYSSTVALGLLAVWQNQKFKEANDKAQKEMEIQNKNAQERLERINREANEINYIGKIIDLEKRYLETVEFSINDFMSSAGFTSMMAMAFSDKMTNDDLCNLRHQITKKYEVIIHLMNAAYVVRNDKSAELDKLTNAMLKKSCALIGAKLESSEISEEALTEIGDIDVDLSFTKIIYISTRQMLLNRMMFEKWPLEKVCSVCSVPVRKHDD